jgi:probable F420-dependent oxidoreductase
VKLGVVFPQTEIGDDPQVIRDFATGIERAGYDFICAYDHVLGHRPSDRERWREIGPYTDVDAFHEVFVLFSHLAALTSRLEFVTEVLVLPQRQTVLVAKQAAELQLLSGGRLRLGVGVGWNPEEFRALGVEFDRRGRRLAEQVQLMRRLWSGEVVTFDGEFHSVHAGALLPAAPASTIPVWVGGHADVALRRAAAIADGFMLELDLERAADVVRSVEEYRAQFRRLEEPFGYSGRVRVDSRDVAGGVEAALEWQHLGISHLAIETMDAGVTAPRRHLELALAFLEGWRQRVSSSSLQ